MKKIIFVFGFLLCLAFGAQAKNLVEVKPNQTTEIKSLVNTPKIDLSQETQVSCISLTIAVDGDQIAFFFAEADTCEEAREKSNAMADEWFTLN